MTRRTLLGGALARPARRKTNVVMIMTDDHGAWAMGAYGCRDIHTPNLDRLAACGARFTNAYACTPVCSPSRMTYLTGKLPSQHGVQDYLIPRDAAGPQSMAFLDGHVTYPEILARHGYTLGMCGKWHMGRDEQAQRGFTWWHTVPGGGGTYRDPEFVTNGQRRKLAGFKTDLVADGALEFLDTVKEKPFYLLVPFYAPHTPYDFQPEAYRQPYAQSSFSCFPEVPMHPWQNPGLAKDHRNRESQRSYSALVTGVDHNVGRILRRLDEMGVRENTLVVFTADQGYNCGHHGVWGKGNGTVPFNLYDESIRVPMIWSHPGRIQAAQTLPPLVSSYDYFPTLLDYLGLPAHRDPTLAGSSYAGFLRGRPPRWRNRLYFEYSYLRGIRTRNLKYVERTKEWPSELYDLEADAGESHNAIGEAGYQKQLAAFRTELAGFFGGAGAPPIEEWRSTTRQNLNVYRRRE
ncbi:MAG: sulfatase-like hydrolase/transferase [Acidobacteria bacterium]|nr:sulfatase-like hydrolase/transferase [Acidobacteriota bacterium]